MALPFQLPSDEDVEENYRRLERLLRDLYQVLHVLLGGGAPVSHPRHPHNQQPPPPPPPPSSGPSVTVPRVRTGTRPVAFPSLFTPSIIPQLPRMPVTSLPNLVTRLPVQKTSGSPVSPPVKSSVMNTTSPAYWSRLGHELRNIADNFQATTSPRRISLQLEMESGAISIVTPQQPTA